MKTLDSFKIHLEQLRDGKTAKINEKFEPEFLDVHEKDLEFKKPVEVNGEVYIAGEGLVLHFVIIAYAYLPCSVCNEPVEVEIAVKNFYHVEPLADIKGGIFNFKEVLREAVLLEVPAFAECNSGNCKKRKELKKFLKDQNKTNEEGYHPFANL